MRTVHITLLRGGNILHSGQLKALACSAPAPAPGHSAPSSQWQRCPQGSLDRNGARTLCKATTALKQASTHASLWWAVTFIGLREPAKVSGEFGSCKTLPPHYTKPTFPHFSTLHNWWLLSPYTENHKATQHKANVPHAFSVLCTPRFPSHQLASRPSSASYSYMLCPQLLSFQWMSHRFSAPNEKCRKIMCYFHAIYDQIFLFH